MDFFARQENARKHTLKLVLLFLGAVLSIIDTALADEKLVIAEAEMLRTIAMALDCPVPPIVEAPETAPERVSASPVAA